MSIAPRTQKILLLVVIPCGIAAGFVVASGNGIAIMAAIILLPHTFAAFFGWLIHKGLKTGIINGRGGPAGRDNEPIWYWINIAVLIAVFVAVTSFAAYVDFEIIRLFR